MATNNKDFVVKNGLIVGDSTNLVNYTAASPSNPFIGQLWINEPYLYAWSSASTWVLVGDGNTGGGGGSASGTPFNIPSTLVARSASGSFQIGAVDFHTASPVSSAIGRLTWDDGSGTTLLGLKGGNINLPIGQQEDALVYNGTGSALARGQVVRIVGAQGQRPRIDLAAAINDANSSKTFGIVAEPILNGAEGFVTTFGIVQNINTAAFTEGASLWLSPSAGGIVSTMPIQPYHNVFLGYCLKSHASSGRIFVKIQNGYEIEELHDVLIQTASNNQILSYNSASSLWMNKDLQAAIKEVDGEGSGIDADLLDGKDSTYFMQASASFNFLPTSASSNYLRIDNASAIYLNKTDAQNIYLPSASYNANDVLNKIKTVDGSGSGLDSDLLDGNDSSYFVNTSSATQEKTGNFTFHGTLTVDQLVVSGSSTFIATQDLSVTDSLILLASEQYNSDGVDIGFIGSYGDGTTSSASHYHASFTRDASQNKWKLLSNGPAPVNNVIDYSDPSVEYGVLQLKTIEVSSSAQINNLNADLLDGQNGSYYLDWTNTTNKPDPIIGVNLIGNTTGAASVTLTDLSNGQISITTNTSFANSASSINWTGVTGTPTTLSGYGITDALPASASSNYLYISTASTIYLTQANASATYVTQQEFNNMRIAMIMGIY